MNDQQNDRARLLELTVPLAVAAIHAEGAGANVPAIIAATYGALEQCGQEKAPAPIEHTPAVSVRSSVKPDHITSLIDGKPYRMLKRHLSTHGLTPDQYRERYGLPATYPMVAPEYAEKRRQIAKDLGLGRGAHPRGRKPARATARR